MRISEAQRRVKPEPYTEAEIERSQARMAHFLGFCPKCADSGWWIEDGPVIYCDCPAGRLALQQEAE